jgi:ribosomal protein L37E
VSQGLPSSGARTKRKPVQGMTLSPEQRKNISEALAQRGATLPCPRCGDDAWTVLDSYISHSLTQNVHQVVIGGPVLPTIGVLCRKCGFLSEHVTVELGIGPS